MIWHNQLSPLSPFPHSLRLPRCSDRARGGSSPCSPCSPPRGGCAWLRVAPVPARKRRAALALSSAPVPPEAMAPGVPFKPALPPAAGSGGALVLPCLSPLSVIGRLAGSLSPSATSSHRLTSLFGLSSLIGSSYRHLPSRNESTQAPWVQRRSWLAAQLHILGLHGI